MYLVKLIRHRGEKRIAVSFEKKQELIEGFKKLEGAKWSATLKVWHLPYTEAYCKLFKIKEENTVQTLNSKTSKQIEDFIRWLKSRRYSENTIKTYTEATKVFLNFFANKPLSDIDNADLIIFNNEYIVKNNLSASYQNQFVNAIKLFFNIVENKKIKVELIHRPKQSKTLPNVLSKQEVKLLLEANTNFKHKTMLSLIYACGLRRAELLNIKPKDVLSDRGLLHIRQAKGKKDRVVPISQKTIEIVREYYKVYKPKVWLFEGQVSGEQYSERSLQQVFKNALTKAKIQKPATLHWLRHSYATHLLESGTDIRYIQELLGHKSSKTTEIYTHVSNRYIQQIKSPFDDL